MPTIRPIYLTTDPTILATVSVASDYFHTTGLIRFNGIFHNNAGTGTVVVSIKNSGGTNVQILSLAAGETKTLTNVFCYGIRITYGGAGTVCASMYSSEL